MHIHIYIHLMHIIYIHTTAEAAIGKGDSLDVYMKSVKDKLDKGTVHEMKLQINKLKKVCNLHVLTYAFEGNVLDKYVILHGTLYMDKAFPRNSS